MKKIKEYWEWFVKLSQSRLFIFLYPCAALTLLSIAPPRLLPFILLSIWVVVVMINTEDED